MKKLIYFGALFVLILSQMFQPKISEADSPSKIDSIVIGTGEWQPYHSISLKHLGVGNHIVSEAFAAVGIKVKFEFMPWKRVPHESTIGELDGISTWGAIRIG